MNSRNLLKNIYMFITEMLKSISSILTILVFSSFRTKCIYKKRTNSATLLANGPSVKSILSGRRDLLKNTDLMVVNSFIETTDFWELRPSYYIIMDPVFFVSNFKVESEETKQPEVCESDKIIPLLAKVDWNMTFFVPQEKMANEFVSKVSGNSNINVVRYNATRIEGFDRFQYWAYKHRLGIPSSRNIIIPALLNFINLGYKDIYLYGAEFSWTKTMDIDSENGKLFFNDRHFYSKSEIRYFGRGGYLWWLCAISEMLHGVDQVAKYAEHVGVEIINRTKGSFIDSFIYENPDTIK